jgi:hypothetical protein
VKKPCASWSTKSAKPDGRTRSRTAPQRRSRGNLSRLSRLWSRLTEEQRTHWRHVARDVRSWTRKGHSSVLDGKQLFTKINLVLLLLGRPLATEPPPRPDFDLNPVEGFRVMRAGGRLVFRLAVKGMPTCEIMVFGSPPQSAGRASCRDYRFLGLLPAPIEGEADITELYIRKYGVPPDNSRVFIRTWQVADGWEDCTGMSQGNALITFRSRKTGPA